MLRVVAIAAQRSQDGSVAVDDLAAILANSLAAHQARLAAGGEAFEPPRIAAAINELQRVEFLETADDGRTRLSPLGVVIAGSTLSVRSAVRVADVLRRAQPGQLSRSTILAAAQLTLEVDAVHLTVNRKGVQAELNTFVGGLRSQGTAPAVINTLGHSSDRIAIAARAKKAIACLLWTNGVPSGQLEQFVMQHYKDRNAIGPIGAVVSRTHDVIDTVMAIAAELHPTIDLTDIRQLLPVQLELGIPAAMAPLALAGANLSRENYLRLHNHGLTTPEAIDEVDDDSLLHLLRNDATSLKFLRDALSTLRTETDTPSLDELLGPSETL